MRNYKILDFKYFPRLLGEYIFIDKNILIFKSYSSNYGYEFIGNRPSYFGERDNIIKNLYFGKKIGCFSTKKKVKLIDIRYISKIINNLVINNENNKLIMKGYNKIALSYGLIPLAKQLELYKTKYYSDLYNYYKYEKMINYYDSDGIRIGEINNDVESTFILKEIFEDYCDGFIIPKIFSHYFSCGYIENELLLFNPHNCLFKVNIMPNNLKSININEILMKYNNDLLIENFFLKNDEYNFYSKINKVDYIFKKNILIDKYYEDNEKIIKLTEIGNEFKKKLMLL
jgi:hypothetical protein